MDEIAKINPTSKAALKQQCLYLASLDIDKAEKMYDFLVKNMDPQAKHEMMRNLYGQMSGGHYDRDYAITDVEKMYYIDKSGAKQSAPYWSENQVHEVYEQVKKDIPAGYNFWDFYVTLQMVRSNNTELLMRWFPEATPQENDKRFVELAINFLKDPDSPFDGSIIWDYLSGKKKVA